jgi:predicted nuclease with TOPRIM domain
LSENARQRDEIESLRVERNRFDTLYKKLEKELSQLQKKKGELIENSTQAYDARYYLLSALMFSKYGAFFMFLKIKFDQ